MADPSHHGHSMVSDAVNGNTSQSLPEVNHNHSGHDHNNHGDSMAMDAQKASGHTGHDNMMMHMYFHGGKEETILFEFWKISETGGLIGSMLAIFFLAFIYEALKFYREHLYRHSFQTIQVNTVALPVENGGGAMKETHKTVQIASTSGSNNPFAFEVNPIFISQGNCTCPVPDEKQESSANNNYGVLPKSPSTNPSSPIPPRSYYKVRMLSWMHGWQTFLHVVQVILSYFLMLIFMTYNVWLCMAVALGAGAGYFFFGWKKSLVVDITEHCH